MATGERRKSRGRDTDRQKDADGGEIILDGKNENGIAEKRNDSPANRKSNSISSAVCFLHACPMVVSLMAPWHRPRFDHCSSHTNARTNTLNNYNLVMKSVLSVETYADRVRED